MFKRFMESVKGEIKRDDFMFKDLWSARSINRKKNINNYQNWWKMDEEIIKMIDNNTFIMQ